VYQRSLSELELWLYNFSTREWQQALWSQYTPAGVRFSQTTTQFSFIDNGRVRVHSLFKRSPRSLEFQEPIYEIGIPEWADEQHLYFSAKKQQVFGIFQTDMQGSLIPLLWDGKSDYIYPQKIDTQLFAIKRHEKEYWLVANEYGINRQPELLYHDQKPMAFLQMVSDQEGFFIRMLKSQNQKIIFGYYHLIATGLGWSCMHLFSFSIPNSLLSGSERLYESIIPFLPHYYSEVFYYVDCGVTDYLEICTYHMRTQQKQKTFSIAFHCFSPIMVKNKIYYSKEKIGDFLDIFEI
jgi:hypothetical protein